MQIQVSEEGGVRYLHFGSDWIQGAMRVARPWALELDYTREMMACLLLRPEPEWPRRVLLVGLGAGSLAKFLYRYRPEARLTVVEIDEQVPVVARRHFRLPDEDARFSVVIGDGVEYMKKKSPRYDLIMVDGFDEHARAGMLDTLPFYCNCRSRLSEQGLLVVNLLSRRKDFRASVARIREAFEGRGMAFPSCDSGNAIAIAGTGPELALSIPELKQAAHTLKSQTSLNLIPTLTRLEGSTVCRGGVLRL